MADPRPQTEEDVFAICYYNYAIVENRKSDEDLVYLLYHNILLYPDVIPRKFNMKKILPMLNYTKAYLSLEYIIQKFKPGITYWIKFLNSDICHRPILNNNMICCCKDEVCPSRETIYKFLDIYTKHCVIRRYKSLLKIFSPYYNNPDLHSISWKLHTGKLIKYCTLRYGDRTNDYVIKLIKFTDSADMFPSSKRGMYVMACLRLE
jgi:hypothetical protein